jgi:glutamate dehydrogenase
VLLAYSKISLYAELLASDLPEDPALMSELAGYFPAPLPERFGDRLGRHRLRREIIATRVTNGVVDRAGITFVFRLREETGAAPADIARAYAVARDVFGMRGFWAEVEALDLDIAAATQIAMLLEGRRLVERATRWLLRSRPRPLDIGPETERFARGAALVADALPGVLCRRARGVRGARGELVADGVPATLARRVASLRDLFAALDIVGVAGATERTIGDVAALHFLVGGTPDLHWLRDRIATLPRDEPLAGAWRAPRCVTTSSACTPTSPRTSCTATRAGGRTERGPRLAWRPGSTPTARLVERCLAILGEIRTGGTYDLTTLAVALRELRNLSRAAGAR